jgi:hypothetical protein
MLLCTSTANAGPFLLCAGVRYRVAVNTNLSSLSLLLLSLKRVKYSTHCRDTKQCMWMYVLSPAYPVLRTPQGFDMIASRIAHAQLLRTQTCQGAGAESLRTKYPGCPGSLPTNTGSACSCISRCTTITTTTITTNHHQPQHILSDFSSPLAGPPIP